MGKGRNAICDRCFKEYHYYYLGGRPRKYCFECKPKKKKRRSFNAYDFNWGDLGYPWRPTKDTGNPTRWMGVHRLVLSVSNERFRFGLLLMGGWHGRSSSIQATAENVPNALIWAETGAQSLIDSFDSF